MAGAEATQNSTDTVPPDDTTELLLAWQDRRCEAALARLHALPLIESVARRSLHRFGIDAASLVDDALSLVLDHLRRLPPAVMPDQLDGPASERAVAPFAPRTGAPQPGRRFLIWLTRRRAADVARCHQRQTRRAGCFSAVNPDRLHNAVANAAIQSFHDTKARRRLDDQRRQLGLLLDLLEPADRQLMELLMEGKTLAVIAHVLDCSEGTVCRRRQRIEQQLREATPPPLVVNR